MPSLLITKLFWSRPLLSCKRQASLWSEMKFQTLIFLSVNRNCRLTVMQVRNKLEHIQMWSQTKWLPVMESAVTYVLTCTFWSKASLKISLEEIFLKDLSGRRACDPFWYTTSVVWTFSFNESQWQWQWKRQGLQHSIFVWKFFIKKKGRKIKYKIK